MLPARALQCPKGGQTPEDRLGFTERGRMNALHIIEAAETRNKLHSLKRKYI